MAPPLLLGHRGARYHAPENTIAAFELALRHGCDGFEFDVRLTSDGYAVVCHDPKFNGLVVAQSTYEQLAGDTTDDAAAALLAARGGLPALEPIPLLDDVIEAFAQRAWLDIHLKVPGLEQATLDAVRRWAPAHGVIVSSFLPEVITSCAALDNQVPLGLIADRHGELDVWESMPVSVILPQRRLLSRALLEEMHVAGKRVIVWTVNDEREMLRLADWGVDGLIADDSALLGRAFHRLR